MKKVTAFIGSAQKKATYEAVREFERNLKSHTEIEFEYVFLKDYRIEFCRGCKLCFNKGKEFCPIQDDRDLLIDKMDHSDGVIFATPNYAFQVSASMKNLLDRTAFLLHRPCFFGKAFTSIVTQGIFGGNSIIKYLGNMGENLGYSVTKGCVLNTLEPSTKSAQENNSLEIKKAAARFYRMLMRQTAPTPSFFRLMVFRISRTRMRDTLCDDYYDYRHYKAKGWFESDYYYDVTLKPFKKLMGWIFDLTGHRLAKQN